MKIAVTGCNGSVGKRVALLALERGHQVVGIDLAPEAADALIQDDHFEYRSADLRDFDVVLLVLKGCEAITHLAGVPNPTDYKVQAHNTSVAGGVSACLCRSGP